MYGIDMNSIDSIEMWQQELDTCIELPLPPPLPLPLPPPLPLHAPGPCPCKIKRDKSPAHAWECGGATAVRRRISGMGRRFVSLDFARAWAEQAATAAAVAAAAAAAATAAAAAAAAAGGGRATAFPCLGQRKLLSPHPAAANFLTAPPSFSSSHARRCLSCVSLASSCLHPSSSARGLGRRNFTESFKCLAHSWEFMIPAICCKSRPSVRSTKGRSWRVTMIL